MIPEEKRIQQLEKENDKLKKQLIQFKADKQENRKKKVSWALKF